MSRAISDFARHAFRAYRNGPITLGHSLIRRSLNLLLPHRQEICLRSGLKLSLDLSKGNQNGIFWEDGDAEAPLYWAIRELVPLGGTFVDCGANCGLMGLLAYQYRMAHVIMIEPHPRLAKSIQANIKLNHCSSSCELIEAAVSDAPGEATFYENPNADGSHSIHSDWPGEKRVLGNVLCVTLQEIMESRRISKIHFLKIDVEGNEYAALKGLGERLEPAFVELIYAEMSRNREAICELMESRGYVGFVNKVRRRRETVRLRKFYEKGGRVAFFAPLKESSELSWDTLWCGKNSPAEVLLNSLTLHHR